ncbi:hypothetical protein D3C85_1794560 [compost metagenome]
MSSNTVEASRAVPKKDVAVIGGTGLAGASAAIGPAIPDVVDAVSSQRDELTSGQWARVLVAVLILSLTLWGIWQKVKS